MGIGGEEQTGASGEVGLPVQVRGGDSWSAQFLVPAVAARALVEPDDLEVVRLLPRRAVAILSFACYRDSDLGPFEEAAVAFLVRRRGGARRRSGLYLRHLARTQPLPVAAARELWGYPSLLAEVAIERRGGRSVCEFAHEGQHVLTLSLREGGPLRLSDPNLPNYGVRGGRLVESAWDQYGAVRSGPGGARLTLGPHPIAAELRSLGLPRRALMSGTMLALQAEFGAPHEGGR